MDRQWYVTAGGQQYGPLTLEEMKVSFQQNRINANSMCWREGMGDWLRACDVPELQGFVESAPPPVPGASVAYGYQQPQQMLSPQDQQIKDKKMLAGIMGILLGSLGIHKFVLGYTSQGVIMLVVYLLGMIACGIPSIVIAIIGLIEGIKYLCATDEEFIRKHKNHSQPWF